MVETLESLVLLNTYSVTNTADSGKGSLRQAITDANSHAGLDTITFSIPGSGVHTIAPASALPQITSPVVLNGTSQPGYAGTPLIEINGAGAGAGVDGLDISAGGSTIEGLAVNRFTGNGIALFGGNGNTIIGDYLGTDPTGTIARGNGSLGLFVNCANNVIGGTTAAARNLISGNLQNGLGIFGSSATGNLVEGNYIGTNATGTAAIPNAVQGVLVNGGAASNIIGGSAAGTRNLISGNGLDGLQFADAGTSGNLVQGNFIGTDVTGATALGNTRLGVLMNLNSAGNVIGTNGDGIGDNLEGNVISGNGNWGVNIGGANGDVVAGNLIGTNASGAAAIPNIAGGVLVNFGSQNNRIGTDANGVSDTAERNLISGNTGDGIFFGDSGTNRNAVAGNYIGTDVTGAAALPNSQYGIEIYNGPQNNVIGGSTSKANVIAFNALAGVTVESNTSTGNTIRFNSIYANGGLAIDLAGVTGVTPNRAGAMPGVGPNNLQNYPLIDSASAGSSTTVAGRLSSLANTVFTLDFYASAQRDVSFYGPGQRYLSAITVTTDASGNATFSATLPAASSTGEWISATATDPAGNTSEFCGSRQLPSTPLTLSTTSWTPIGPSPMAQSPLFNGPITSGRISVAAADPSDPNTMYLAADGGGIWKTTNWLSSSPTWTPLTDSQSSTEFNNASYTTLVVHAGSPNIIYGATSGPGGGILKSSDGGATWTLLGHSVFDQVSFGGLVVDPTNANNLFATVWFGPLANSGGVWRSNDGGATWTNVTASFHTGYASDIAMDPTNPSVLYAGLVGVGGASSTNGIYKTTDGGTTWTRLANGILTGAAIGVSIRLAISPSSPQTLYATVFDPALGNPPDGLPHRYRSADGGNTWTALSALPSPDMDEFRYWHVVLAVDPSNAQTIYVNGDHTLYESTNGGASWTHIFDEDPVGGYFDQTGALVITGDRGIYRWTGAGPVQIKQGNLQTGEFYTLTLDPTDPTIVYGIAQDQGAPMRYTDYPVWNYLGAPPGGEENGGETGKILVNPTTPSRVYDYTPGDSSSFILRSDDGGATWVEKGSGIPTTLAGFGLAYASQKAFQMDPSNVHRLIVGTNQVYETTNDGDAWTPISPVLSPSPNLSDQYITALAIAPSAPGTIYAATADGRLWFTQNDGGTWVERDSGLPRDSFDQIVDIKVDPANPLHVFIVPGRFPNAVFGPSHVWVTTNGGTSWTDIRGNLPSEDYTNAIVVDWRPATPILYVGTARGVYRSMDSGTTWSLFGQALPNSPVSDLQFVPSLNVLAAATYGRGVFEIEIQQASAATHFSISGPTTVTAGVSFSVTVTALDANNNVASSYRGTVAFTSSDPRAVRPANYTFTAADNGVHTFTFTLKTAGTRTITATDTVNATITGTLSSILVNPNVTTTLAISGLSSVTAGAPRSFSVRATDAYGNTTPIYRGTVHFTSSDSRAILPADYMFTTADNGVHSFTLTMKTAGRQTVTVTDTSVSRIKGTQTVTVNPATASTLVFTVLYPSPTMVGSANNFTVTLYDAFGNIATGYRGTLHFTSTDTAAGLPHDYTFTATDAGVHTFSATFNTVGTWNLTATDTVHSGLTFTQTGIVVNASGARKRAFGDHWIVGLDLGGIAIVTA
jgi:hypothetical protein